MQSAGKFSLLLHVRCFLGCYIGFFICLSCGSPDPEARVFIFKKDSTGQMVPESQPAAAVNSEGAITEISTGNTAPAELITFARTMKGTPYKYGSIDPAQGFDCSGFITYVFNHFNIAVPRSSVDFTSVNRSIEVQDAKPGDLILFTGTDSRIRVVGHMGIVVSAPGEPLSFIHSTSGKAFGVTESPLNPGYVSRFMKVIRIFPQNDQ